MCGNCNAFDKMEKTITFTVNKKVYVKAQVSRAINARLLVFYFVLLLVLTVPVIQEYKSALYIFTHIIVMLGCAALIYRMVHIFIAVRSAYIFDQEKPFLTDVTIEFRENEFEERSRFGSFTLEYAQIQKMELYKQYLRIDINAVRFFIIPASDEYRIQELYDKLKSCGVNQSNR